MPKRWLSLHVVLLGLSVGHTAKADRLRDLVDVVVRAGPRCQFWLASRAS